MKGREQILSTNQKRIWFLHVILPQWIVEGNEILFFVVFFAHWIHLNWSKRE